MKGCQPLIIVKAQSIGRKIKPVFTSLPELEGRKAENEGGGSLKKAIKYQVKKSFAERKFTGSNQEGSPPFGAKKVKKKTQKPKTTENCSRKKNSNLLRRRGRGVRDPLGLFPKIKGTGKERGGGISTKRTSDLGLWIKVRFKSGR